MKITHILWDWNGTLLDDFELCVRTINSILADEGLPRIDRGEYRRQFCFPVRTYYHNVGLPVDEENFDRLAKLFIARYQPASAACGLSNGAESAVRALDAAGIVQTVLSASRADLLAAQVARTGLAPCFRELLGLSDIRASSKLDIGAAYKRRERLDGSSVLLVGDTYHDFEVARRLGADFLYYRNGHQLIENEAALGIRGIDSIADAVEYIRARNADSH